MIHVTFTTRRETCPPVQINNGLLPQAEDVKYLGQHLDKRLTWHKHFRKTETTRNRLHQNVLVTRTQVRILHKLLLYKAILKAIWTYGVQLWGTA
jgi:hypothetical protein